MVESAQSFSWQPLIAEAAMVRQNAYAPYSQFFVGAAVLCRDQRVYVGVNVENCAYGSTICAERHSVGAAVAAGHRQFLGIAVVTDSPTITTPCGACLQVLAELGVPTVVLHNLRDAQTQVLPIAALLPHAPPLHYLARSP